MEGLWSTSRLTIALLVTALIAVLLMFTLGPAEATLPVPAPTAYPASMFTPVAVEPSASPAQSWLPTLAPMPLDAPAPALVTRPTTRPVVIAHPKPVPVIAAQTNGTVRGIATYYCNADNPDLKASICMARHPDTNAYDAYAAAGPALRRAIGGGDQGSCRPGPHCWRNHKVTVCSSGKPHGCLVVTLADWCACGSDHVIDLYGDPFVVMLANGGNPVTITW